MEIVYTNENRKTIIEKKIDKLNELLKDDEVLATKYGMFTNTNKDTTAVLFCGVRCKIYDVDNNEYAFKESDPNREAYIIPSTFYIPLHCHKPAKTIKKDELELIQKNIAGLSEKLNSDIQKEKIDDVVHKVENEIKYRIRRALGNKNLVISAKSGHLHHDYLLELTIKDEWCGDMNLLEIETFDDDYSIAVHYGTYHKWDNHNNTISKKKYIIFPDRELRNEITEYFERRNEEKWI